MDPELPDFKLNPEPVGSDFSGAQFNMPVMIRRQNAGTGADMRVALNVRSTASIMWADWHNVERELG
jgi:hypothetical protein